MTRYSSIDDLELQGTWLAIGVFDGVHIGHQVMLQKLSEGAQAENAPSAVLTFYPHPAVILGKREEFKWLSPIDERTELILNQGIDHVILQEFDRKFANTTAETFMKHLSRKLGIRHLLVGRDFALGHKREGDIPFLVEFGKKEGYEVHTIETVSDNVGVISSSLIRNLLHNGQVSEVKNKLGRPYALHGVVVHGDGRGRTINIPTANLQLPKDKLVPGNGVYACQAILGSVRKAAVTNIGTRPTFNSGEQSVHVETHLFDHQQDMYGEILKLEFVKRLRSEMRFPDVNALLEQIHKDIRKARSLLE
ncbi:bifunctional riboflavin kinase/FAD synthetase [Chloroflexota bacterium]